MSMWLTNQQLQGLQRAYQKRVECPVPTQVISSGECYPPPQTQQQAQVESLIQEEADRYASRQGISRRTYLRSSSGMAAAFLVMNQVHGEVYNVNTDEAEDQEAAGARKDETKDQFPEWYRTRVDDREYELDMHVGKGTSFDPQNTIRIAFDWDDEGKRVVVGYIGRHQKNRRS